MPFENKYDEALFCLDQITELAGEEELSDCKEYDIEVTSEIGPAWRANQIGLYVERPYDQKIFEDAMDQLQLLEIPRHDTNRWIEIVDAKTIRYIQIEELSSIADVIFGRLENECRIKDSDLSEGEWGKLQDSSDWRKAEVEVARELIASDLLETI